MHETLPQVALSGVNQSTVAAGSQQSHILVPKLCLGTQALETPFQVLVRVGILTYIPFLYIKEPFYLFQAQ